MREESTICMREESTIYRGKERFDLRLLMLRLIRSLPLIIGITLLGTLLIGGGYYAEHIWTNYYPSYEVTSTYQVSYVNEPSQAGDYYINEMTWNTYVTSKEFLDAVLEHYNAIAADFGDAPVYSTLRLEEMVTAQLASDIHVPSTTVTSGSPVWTMIVARAVEEAMMEEFVKNNEQVAAIRIIDPAQHVTRFYPDARPLRAFVLGAILSFFCALVVFLLKEMTSASVWLPATLRKRFGIPVLGTINSPELRENVKHVLAGKTKMAIYTNDVYLNLPQVIAALQEKLDNGPDSEQTKKEWKLINVLCPLTCEKIHDSDGLLLVVKAGKSIGMSVEYELDYFETQDIKVDAVLLWDADEWLIRTYYMLPKKRFWQTER